MKDSKFNMSQDLCFFFLWGGVEDGPVTKENFYGTEERNVSQGDILDTSLNLTFTVFHLQSFVPSMDEHACRSVH